MLYYYKYKKGQPASSLALVTSHEELVIIIITIIRAMLLALSLAGLLSGERLKPSMENTLLLLYMLYGLPQIRNIALSGPSFSPV